MKRLLIPFLTLALCPHARSDIYQHQLSELSPDMRAASMRAPQGLEDLAIGDGFDSNGLKGIGGGGGQYSLAHDANYQLALARGDFDGDDDE